ncbi:hypothetical protein E4U52_002640 [Claviceps spartinae]|nr:hypothetical protein E4U52_002640 [Claviceps spartinae]
MGIAFEPLGKPSGFAFGPGYTLAHDFKRHDMGYRNASLNGESPRAVDSPACRRGVQGRPTRETATGSNAAVGVR